MAARVDLTTAEPSVVPFSITRPPATGEAAAEPAGPLAHRRPRRPLFTPLEQVISLESAWDPTVGAWSISTADGFRPFAWESNALAAPLVGQASRAVGGSAALATGSPGHAPLAKLAVVPTPPLPPLSPRGVGIGDPTLPGQVLDDRSQSGAGGFAIHGPGQGDGGNNNNNGDDGGPGTGELPVVYITALDANAAERRFNDPTQVDPGAFSVGRTGDITLPLTAHLFLSGGATPDLDYVSIGNAPPGPDYAQVDFAPGQKFVTLTVTPIADSINEADEEVRAAVVQLVGYSSAYRVGTPSTASVVIQDVGPPPPPPPPPPTPQLSITAPDSVAVETPLGSPANHGTFLITSSIAVTADLTVAYAVGGAATPGADYQSLFGQAVIPAGGNSTTILIQPVDDALVEDREDVVFTLKPDSANPARYTLGKSVSAQLQIFDNDSAPPPSPPPAPPGPPTVSVTPSPADASETGPRFGRFKITRTGSVATDLSINASWSGSASAGDFTTSATAGASVTIPKYFNTATIDILPVDDSLVEPTETVTLTLSSGDGYVLGASEATITIADNDVPRLLLTASADAPEYDGTLTFTVTRTLDLSGDLTVPVSLGGSATAGVDYSGAVASVHLPDGVASASFQLAALDDPLQEGDESVAATITAVGGYTVDAGSVRTFILDDDDVSGIVLDEPATDGSAGAPPALDLGFGGGGLSVSGLDGHVVVAAANQAGYQGDCSCSCSCDDGPPIAMASLPSAESFLPIYSTASLPHLAPRMQATLPADAPIADRHDVRLTIDDVVGDVRSYSAANRQPGQDVQFAAPVFAPDLPTGRHPFTAVIEAVRGDSVTRQTVVGSTLVVNRLRTEFGPGFWPAALQRLLIEPNGVTLLAGDGSHAFFAADGADFTTPPGWFQRLQAVAGGYSLTDRFGGVALFNAAGLLTQRRDRDANTVTLGYLDADADGLADELATITDPFGRVTTYAYVNGFLRTITDHAGRATTYLWNSSFTQLTITEPDPDAGGPLAAPATTLSFDAQGLLREVRGPAQPAPTRFDYNLAGRVESVRRPDGGVWRITLRLAAEMDLPAGLAPRGGPSNPAAFNAVVEVDVAIDDPLNHRTTYRLDARGLIVRITDPLGRFTTIERDGQGLPTSQTLPDPDAGGPLPPPVTLFQYDARANLTQLTLPNLATYQWTYDPAFSQPLSVTDPLGRTTTYALSATGNRLSRLDALGRLTTYQYNTRGLITQVVLPDPDGPGPLAAPATQFAIDAFGRVQTVTHPDGAAVQLGHDVADNLVQIVDETGAVTTQVFDRLDRRIEVIQPDPDGPAGPLLPARTRYHYQPDGALERFQTPLGHTFFTSFDDDGRLGTISYSSSYDVVDLYAAEYDLAGRLSSMQGSSGGTWVWESNAAGEATAELDPWRNRATFINDQLGRPIEVRAPLGRTSRFHYDVMGNVVGATDPLGGTSSATFDVVGRMLSAVDVLGRATSWEWDSLSDRLESVTLPDPDGGGPLPAPVWSYNYDALDRVTSVIAPGNRVHSSTYNSRGWITAAVDPSGAPWQFGYDAAGRQTSLVDPLARTWTTVYDAAGRPIRQTDPLQRVTLVRYDSMDQPIEVEAPDGVLTGYVYNRLGQVTHVTENLDPDPIQLPGGGSLPTDSRTTFLDINPWGVLERVVDPIGGETSFERDLAGRLTAVVDPADNRTEYQFDAAGRLTRKLDPAPNAWWGEPTTDYAYDLNDQVVSVVDANGREREYLRDAAGRVTEERWSGYGGAASTIATTYDALDRPVAITDPAASLTFSYDAALDLTSVVTQPTGRAASRLDYAHDAAGRLVSTSEIGADLSARSQTVLSRDAAGRVTRTRQTIAGDPVGREVNVGYDAADLATSITRGPINAAPLVTTSLGYDVRDRLTTLSHAGPSGPLSSYAYTYDVFGQLTSETNASPGGGSVEYDYDLSGQLTEVSGARNRTYEHDANGVRLVSPTDVVDGGNRLVWSGSRQFGYDAVGNTQMIWDGAANQTRYFAYDHRNRLVDAELRNAQQEVIARASFTYDALDRRIGVEEDADGAGPGAPVSTWTAFDGAQAWSDSDASGTVQARYLSGPAVDALLARSDASGETDWYLTDRLGSVRQVVDDSGASIFQAWFDEYGKETSSVGAGGDRFGFTGRDSTDALGLQWNRARYYLPEDGRWLSQDPIGFGGGDPNLYRYVGNSPTNATDPSGLFKIYNIIGDIYNDLTSEEAFYRTLGGLQVVGGTLEMAAAGALAAAPEPTLTKVFATGVFAVGADTVANGWEMMRTGRPSRSPLTTTASWVAQRGFDVSRSTADSYADLGMPLLGVGLAGGVGRAASRTPILLEGGRDVIRFGEIRNCFTERVGVSGLVRSANPTHLNPSEVNFSQRTVSSNVSQYIEDMTTPGGWDWSKSGPIRVMQRNGQWVSYDNRRLMAARQAGLTEVPVQVVEPDAMYSTTKTWEQAFRNRFLDPRNVRAGGPVPNQGLADLPVIAPPR